ETRRPCADRLDQLGEEGAPEHGDFGARIALERVERQRHPQRLTVPEKRAFALGQAQLGVIGAERGLFHTGERAVALEQRSYARVGERIGVAARRGDGRPVYGQTPSREFTRALLARFAAAFHAASASMSTSVRGRRSTCATRVIARPALVKPVSRTSSPYSG